MFLRQSYVGVKIT